MNRKTVSGTMLTLLLIGMLTLAFNIQPVKAEPKTIIVPDDYPTIQEAINNANEGDTIYAKAQLYYENIVINKNNLTLLGEDKDTTIIDGSGSLTVMHVTANNVIISGFTIQNGFGGIVLVDSDSCAISGNIITNNGNATRLISSDYCHIVGNVISDNFVLGIRLYNSDNSLISNNVLVGNGHGIGLVSYSMNNTVVGNKVTLGQYDGIGLGRYCNNNVVACNTLSDNQHGMRLYLSSESTIYHNNFINNTQQVYIYTSGYANVWDDGYPSGGNYWSDYEERYPDAKELDGSGIWSTPYVIDENNQDNYPLMEPWSPIEVPPVEDTEAYIDYVNKTMQNLPDDIFNKPGEDVPDVKDDFSDLFDDALESIDEGNYEGAIEKLNTIKMRMYEEIVESEERQETISLIDDLITCLQTLL